MKTNKLFQVIVVFGTGMGATLSACEDKPSEPSKDNTADAGARSTTTPTTPRPGAAPPGDGEPTTGPSPGPAPAAPEMTPFPGWAAGAP